MAWYRRKFWKSTSEKYIPEDPNQRKIDFEGLDVLPEEQEVIEKAAKEIISYKRKKPENKKKPVRLPLPDHLRREKEIIEPEGIDENWVRIGQEVTEILEHKPGELYVRQIIRPKYVLKKELQKEQEQSERRSTEEEKCKNSHTSFAAITPQQCRRQPVGGTSAGQIHASSSFPSTDSNVQTSRCQFAGLHGERMVQREQ